MYGHLSDRTYTIQYEFFVQSIFVLPPANFDIIDLQFYQIGLIQYEFFLLSIFARSAHVFSVDKIIWNLRVVKEEGKKISDWLSIIDGRESLPVWHRRDMWVWQFLSEQVGSCAFAKLYFWEFRFLGSIQASSSFNG